MIYLSFLVYPYKLVAVCKQSLTLRTIMADIFILLHPVYTLDPYQYQSKVDTYCFHESVKRSLSESLDVTCVDP